jgi:hypothetical protein
VLDERDELELVFVVCLFAVRRAPLDDLFAAPFDRVAPDRRGVLVVDRPRPDCVCRPLRAWLPPDSCCSFSSPWLSRSFFATPAAAVVASPTATPVATFFFVRPPSGC